MKNKQIQKNFKKSFFVVYAVLLIFAAFGVTIAAADTSVAWTKDIGDVTAADMSEDGAIIYAAIADGADSTLFVYDNSGTQQNTFSISGNVEKIVCTADGSKAILYTDGNAVYYIDEGQITWTEQFTDITDIEISDVGNVLVVESDIFHKYLSDGSIDYNSASGTFDLGVLDPNDDFAIVQSGTSKLDKYILTTTNDYWAKNNYNSFNTNYSDYQNLLILYTNETSAIILNKDTLGDEIWSEIVGSNFAISNEALSETGAYNYYDPLGVNWTSATNSAAWSARLGAIILEYNNKLWIIGGLGFNDVWSSSDGITWEQVTSSAAWSARPGAWGYVFNNKMWIAGGSGFRDVWSSSDGITWEQVTSSAAWSARGWAASYVFGGKMWIAGGSQTSSSSSTRYNDVWSSSDGITWERVTSSAAWSTRRAPCGWVYDNKLWIAGGWAGSGSSNDVWSSSDGITWEQVTSSAAWSARGYACSWILNNQMYIGGGFATGSSNTGYNDIWSSSDGITWEQVTSSAAWSARWGAAGWVYDNKLWIAGGGTSISGSGNPQNDIWYSQRDYYEIMPSANGQTYLFYHYTGDSPQHTQTTYNNAVDFTGTTELRTKPELSIYEYQASKTYTGAIESISISDAGDWLGTSTASRVYHDQVTSEGYGISYNAVLGSEGTVYEIATANEAAMSVIGQGQYTDIYSQIAARVGTYTAGGDVRHVDIAGNALWATSGGSDGKMYLFSKDQSSNWYLEYSSESGDPITALKMATDGSYILAGRTDGLTFYQQTSPSPQPSGSEFWFTLYTYKDSDSYRNAAVNVSVYSGNQWSGFAQGVTDSVGKYVILLTAGQNYKFDVGNGEKIMIYQATPNVNSQTISIYSSPISSSVTYSATWDTQAGGIQFKYADSSGQTQNLNVKIMRTDTWETVYEETFTGTESINETLPIIDDTTSYKVEFSANRVSGVTRNNFFVSASQDIIPIPLDKNILNVLFSCLLILIAGLFSYMSAIRGAVVVAMCAIFFTYLGWLTIPWHWLIIAIVIAMVAGFTQRRS